MSPSTIRRDQLADAAITVIAEHGMRGLTHRSVDAAAGAPVGTTSNHARTRLAILLLAMERITELDAREPSLWPVDLASLEPAEMLASLSESLHSRIERGTPRLKARFELALEATRVRELRTEYDRAGLATRAELTDILLKVGTPHSPQKANVLIAWLDGILFDAVAGPGNAAPPTQRELAGSLAPALTLLLP
jgi:DNA-binding transcriptional regulator YbjK